MAITAEDASFLDQSVIGLIASFPGKDFSLIHVLCVNILLKLEILSELLVQTSGYGCKLLLMLPTCWFCEM